MHIDTERLHRTRDQVAIALDRLEREDSKGAAAALSMALRIADGPAPSDNCICTPTVDGGHRWACPKVR